MKLIAFLLLAIGTVRMHATESGPVPTASGVTETHITSQSVSFDLKTRQAVYRGDVRVDDPRIALTCDFLTATISESGGRVDNLIAESNVVAVIVTNNTTFTVTAAKAIYTYRLSSTATNQTLELTGTPEPRITWPQEGSEPPRTNEFVARRILWDISTGNIDAEGHRGIFPSVDALSNPMKEIQRAATNSAPPAPGPKP
jgi:lipopolysaccharide export system protein LptA